MAEFVTGLQPNAANEFTRGGFLESAEQANPLPSWQWHITPQVTNHISKWHGCVIIHQLNNSHWL